MQAKSSSASKDLRTEAVKYIRNIRYFEGYEKIVRLAASPDEDNLKREALITSAALRPTDQLFLAEVRKLLDQRNPRSFAVRTAAEVAIEISRPRQSSENETERIATSKQLLKFAFTHGAYVQTSFLERPFSAVFHPIKTLEGQVRVSIWHPTSRTSSSAIALGGLSELEHFKPYWELIQEAADENSLENLKIRLVRSDRFDVLSPRGPNVIRVKIPKSGALIVSDSNEEVQVTEKSDVYLLPRSRSTEDLYVLWADSNKNSMRSRLIRLSGNGFTFDIRELPKDHHIRLEQRLSRENSYSP